MKGCWLALLLAPVQALAVAPARALAVSATELPHLATPATTRSRAQPICQMTPPSPPPSPPPAPLSAPLLLLDANLLLLYSMSTSIVGLYTTGECERRLSSHLFLSCAQDCPAPQPRVLRFWLATRLNA